MPKFCGRKWELKKNRAKNYIKSVKESDLKLGSPMVSYADLWL